MALFGIEIFSAFFVSILVAVLVVVASIAFRLYLNACCGMFVSNVRRNFCGLKYTVQSLKKITLNVHERILSLDIEITMWILNTPHITKIESWQKC